MKKNQFVLALLVAVCFAFQAAAFAGTVSGTVKSVDAEAKKLEVETAEGSSWVAYGDTTQWPAEVTDPSSLVGKNVDVTTDEAGAATAVAEAL